MAQKNRFRWAWWVVAYAALGLGIAGVVLPIVPTVPFILLAAYAAARGSDRLHAYLLRHPLFGPMIRDWQATGAVSRRAKVVAVATMLLCATILFIVSPRMWIAVAATIIMTIVGTWLWLRPEPSEPAAKQQ